jgi:hypothetical protein
MLESEASGTSPKRKCHVKTTKSRRDFLLQGLTLGAFTTAMAHARPNQILSGSGLLVSAAGAGDATAPAPPTIDIDTTMSTPIQPGFSGVNTDLTVPIEYWDYRFNALASQMNYGWLRFPGGTSGDIYDWQTGQEKKAWLKKFQDLGHDPFNSDLISFVEGRGGTRLIDASNRANQLGATLIICVNGFVDSVNSIGLEAQYVKDNKIRVAAWELCNEPYLFPGFFSDATAYLDSMKPYHRAIKQVDPNAIISIFVTDQAKPGAAIDPWNQAVAAYPDKYWDAISFHHYPPQSRGDFDHWMKEECAVLASRTTSVVVELIGNIGPRGVKILNTEFDPSIPNNSKGGSSITDGTVWGGIYSAEYIMRMSKMPPVLHVGPAQIAQFAGVSSDEKMATAVENDVVAAASASAPIDTMALPFGFYITAQALGLAVLNGVINHAVQVNKTTVHGGASVPASGLGLIPAIYAMSYSNAQGGLSVVITNKGSSAQQVTIHVDNTKPDGPIPLQFISGVTNGVPDASVKNSFGAQNVSIQTATSGNPITVPPFSVVRADIVSVFPPAVP